MTRVQQRPPQGTAYVEPGRVHRRSDDRPRHDDARLATLGIHRYASDRLVLYTDIEPGVARTLPPLVDEAYERWVAYFGALPPDREEGEFQITGYLMRDADRFEDAGLVPVDLPRFLNGRHRGYEFWMYDQEQPYYRRHLVLHEATHCFTTCLPGVRMPSWYLEGVAELFATHEWVEGRTHEPSPRDPRPLILRVMPFDKEHFEGLGRISLIEEAVAAGEPLAFDGVGRLRSDDYLEPDAYAWAWAAAKFLDGHPRYAERFRNLGRRVVIDAVPFETAFVAAFGDELAAIRTEWPAFVAGLETGYDLARAGITLVPGEPPDGRVITIRADRGWQSSGVRVLAGESYEVTASGRFTVATFPKPWVSEANGVSIRYIDGEPLGRLLGSLVPDDLTGSSTDASPFLDVTPLGNRAHYEARADGTLYLRLNDAWSELADNSGSIEVTIE